MRDFPKETKRSQISFALSRWLGFSDTIRRKINRLYQNEMRNEHNVETKLCSISMKSAQLDTVSMFYIAVVLPSNQVSWLQQQNAELYISVDVIHALQ
jgi:intracellular sulfur oxidation DsrE/DsrF family protein